jgi:hypothetical protein
VEVGGLMSYAADNADLYRRGAIYVDKILRGARPADLPVEQPTKFAMVLNRKTAKALGLTLPPALLLQADQVINWALPGFGWLRACAERSATGGTFPAGDRPGEAATTWTTRACMPQFLA